MCGSLFLLRWVLYLLTLNTQPLTPLLPDVCHCHWYPFLSFPSLFLSSLFLSFPDPQSVMEEHELGPNGSLVYCMEHLLAHADWLIGRIEELTLPPAGSDNASDIPSSSRAPFVNYLIFDCPGQVELYTHYSCVQDLVHDHLERSLDARLTCVHLIDSVHCW